MSAIIADDESLAMGVLRALTVLKLCVPEDLSLIVISGDPSLAQKTEPLLTTVDLRASRLGEAAVDTLFKKMKIVPGDTEWNGMIHAKIIEKNSCRRLE